MQIPFYSKEEILMNPYFCELEKGSYAIDMIGNQSGICSFQNKDADIKRPRILLQLNKCIFNILVDTGAHVSIISNTFLEKLLSQ